MKALIAAIAVLASVGAFTESALANISIRINLGSSPVRRIYRNPVNHQGYGYNNGYNNGYYNRPNTIRYGRYNNKVYQPRAFGGYRNDTNSRVILREAVPSRPSGFYRRSQSGFIPAPYNSHLRTRTIFFR